MSLASEATTRPLDARLMTRLPGADHGLLDVLRMTPIGLTGNRVVVKSYQLEDAIDVWQAIDESRQSLLKWVPDIGRRRSLYDVRDGLARLLRSGERNRLICGVWERSSCRVLGGVGLYHIGVETRVAELGYWLRTTARGSGFATEALTLLMEYAVGELRLDHFEAFIGMDNSASRRVAERLGMNLAGLVAADPVRDGPVANVLLYRLDKQPRDDSKTTGATPRPE
jgi:ribosomal-protein-serine acetyltransferase